MIIVNSCNVLPSQASRLRYFMLEVYSDWIMYILLAKFNVMHPTLKANENQLANYTRKCFLLAILCGKYLFKSLWKCVLLCVLIFFCDDHRCDCN